MLLEYEITRSLCRPHSDKKKKYRSDFFVKINSKSHILRKKISFRNGNVIQFLYFSIHHTILSQYYAINIPLLCRGHKLSPKCLSLKHANRVAAAKAFFCTSHSYEKKNPRRNIPPPVHSLIVTADKMTIVGLIHEMRASKKNER